MWKYYAFRIAGFTLAYLPVQVGYAIAGIAADIVYLSSPSLRASVEDNMRHVLGTEADAATLKRAARGVMRNAAKNYFDQIKIPRMNLRDIENNITLKGWHNLEDALARGKGVVLVTAHLGSFDMGAQIFPARSVKTTILVEPLEPPVLLNHVIALRESQGLNVVPVQLGTLRSIIRSLHDGEAVVVACDRDFGNDSLRSDFFGEEASLPVGAVRIAARTGAAIIPVFNLRRGANQYTMCFEPAVPIDYSGNGTVAENVRLVTEVLEKYIKKCPEQWVVLSPIWT
ncbi:MAG: lysophospholipid acyltransferase family protein [Chloroflexota bacterium]|nr:lysophospholipid acyltransferase family protein [Chloroflexota bacterium]